MAARKAVAKKRPAAKPRPAARRSTHKVHRKKPAPRAARPTSKATTKILGRLYPEHGGIYVGVIRGETGQPDAELYAPVGVEIKGAWGPTTRITDALSGYDGMANTKALAAAGSEIAKKALAFKHAGHKDFYIAATHEACLVDINGRDSFEKGSWYWTSTQYELLDVYAWLQLFGGNGDQILGRKSNEYRALLLRRQLVQ